MTQVRAGHGSSGQLLARAFFETPTSPERSDHGGVRAYPPSEDVPVAGRPPERRMKVCEISVRVSRRVDHLVSAAVLDDVAVDRRAKPCDVLDMS